MFWPSITKTLDLACFSWRISHPSGGTSGVSSLRWLSSGTLSASVVSFRGILQQHPLLSPSVPGSHHWWWLGEASCVHMGTYLKTTVSLLLRNFVLWWTELNCWYKLRFLWMPADNGIPVVGQDDFVFSIFFMQNMALPVKLGAC